VPRVALPRLRDWGDRLRFLRSENVPGAFPFTAGVFPFRRPAEDPARMFAGEGGPEATNRRFHLLAAGQPAARLSTAFDSVTLYGCNPDRRPDIYGKIGNSGVSVCSLDDAKKLYSGFDLCDPKTSVSLTINGPAPTVLAFFLNAAIDQQVERHLVESGELEAVRARFEEETGTALPRYEGPLPAGHDGLGLGLLGIPGDFAVSGEVYEAIRADVLQRVRGTVQADILKEDQAQNTCIFSTEFSLKVMGDIQEYFVAKGVRNFYSVSISGYHMAEAGANPITQLAFTLANGFTYCEHYLARGMKVDDFAPNFSFFFSSGLDAEYSVMGRVARRIWAVGMRERYGARERSQKLKYHIQTSGRSLHAQEMSFNDIRTTLQALTALQDQCNSLHTNAFDEAVTTPTEASVRRALAIQLILQREFGPQQNENPLQGSYFSETLTDAVEEAVLAEFERLSERGGVLGAMESLYQRGRIQDESLLYESKKHSGEIPIVGVNTFLDSGATPLELATPELRRSDDAAKEAQLAALASFEARWNAEVEVALEALRRVALEGGNVFAELLETVKRASLGQISGALFDVGGRYRRSM
ncbi:MAG: methylmalonyl-CoA mutase family protein, partial [Myxococcota bacterium]